jgi:hypothetical protein
MCTCVCVCMLLRMYVKHAYVHTCIHACMYNVSLGVCHMHFFENVFVRFCCCIRVYMCTCMYEYMYIRRCTVTKRVSINTMCVCVYTYIHTYIHTYVQTYIHICIYTYIDICSFDQCMCMCACAKCMRICTHDDASAWKVGLFGQIMFIYAYIHVHACVCIWIYVYMYVLHTCAYEHTHSKAYVVIHKPCA